tara:strand:+ start:1785 stop:2159 length:375 start_codon:yes stop_codon:yes gene_type:complete
MSNTVLLFSVTEERVKHTFDSWIWDKQYSEQMVFDTLSSLRKYIYEWYEMKEKALADVEKEGRVEMHMTHHLDLQSQTQYYGRTDLLPHIIITFFTPAGAPRKRYMVGMSNMRRIRYNPKPLTE